jgi:hypothetical protein
VWRSLVPSKMKLSLVLIYAKPRARSSAASFVRFDFDLVFNLIAIMIARNHKSNLYLSERTQTQNKHGRGRFDILFRS